MGRECGEIEMWARRPVSRVLCRLRTGATIIPLDRPLPDGSRDQPGHLGPATALPSCEGAMSLFGLAPGGACHAVPVARSAVRSYRTLSPLPLLNSRARGGLLSVALSLGSLPAGVARRLVAVEPGLSSTSPKGSRDRPAVWPRAQMGRDGAAVNRARTDVGRAFRPTARRRAA